MKSNTRCFFSMTFLSTLLLSSASYSKPIELIQVGDTPNQVLPLGKYGLVIDSGINATPSLSVVNLIDHKKIQRDFPAQSNPYRMSLANKQLYVTLMGTGEIVDFPISGLKAKGDINYNTLVSPATFAFGPESIVHANGYFWVAYNNIGQGFKFGPGVIGAYHPSHAKSGATQVIEFEEKNPKSLVVLQDQRIVVALGMYGANDGQIVILPGEITPNSPDRLEISQKKPGPAEYISTGGTPGSLFQEGKTLFACDLESQGGLISVDLDKKQVRRISLKAKTCGVVAANSHYIYVSDLNGGESEQYRNAVYVLDRKSAQTVCQFRFRNALSQPFVSDLKLHKVNQDLNFLLATLSASDELAIVELDPKGLPRVCNNQK